MQENLQYVRSILVNISINRLDKKYATYKSTTDKFLEHYTRLFYNKFTNKYLQLQERNAWYFLILYFPQVSYNLQYIKIIYFIIF